MIPDGTIAVTLPFFFSVFLYPITALFLKYKNEIFTTATPYLILASLSEGKTGWHWVGTEGTLPRHRHLFSCSYL